ncbi:MAG: preprotein translocase subunit YajC [Christensenellales bacterium]|jgi:preprotein translocase subunit YajC|uniref:preprotein translocase subunit YajC n=1 Tax=Agathobaculum sp. TaxID=2048138 RepID=UPI002EBE3B84|nr:preprotein translocase subunit YajC [Christensenellales bacterium]
MKYALMNLLADAAATTATTDAAAATETMSTGATIIYYAVQFVPMILIFVVFYFLLIRPQRKKDKEAKAMLDNLKVGDRICTIGGIYGTIVRIKDDVLTIEVGEQKTQMVFARWAVRNVEQLSVTNDSEQLI